MNRQASVRDLIQLGTTVNLFTRSADPMGAGASKAGPWFDLSRRFRAVINKLGSNLVDPIVNNLVNCYGLSSVANEEAP